MINGVVPHDEYRDEMDMLGINATQCEFGVSVIEFTKKVQTFPAHELLAFIILTTNMYEGIVGPVKGVSDFVDPLLFFDILSGFVTCPNYVSNASIMDLSIYKYSLVFWNDVSLPSPYSPIPQILDIDDEIV